MFGERSAKNELDGTMCVTLLTNIGKAPARERVEAAPRTQGRATHQAMRPTRAGNVAMDQAIHSSGAVVRQLGPLARYPSPTRPG